MKQKQNKGVSLGAILEHPIKLSDEIAEEVLEREVKPFGRTGHISIPVKHLGKKVRIIILKNKVQNAKRKK